MPHITCSIYEYVTFIIHYLPYYWNWNLFSFMLSIIKQANQFCLFVSWNYSLGSSEWDFPQQKILAMVAAEAIASQHVLTSHQSSGSLATFLPSIWNSSLPLAFWRANMVVPVSSVCRQWFEEATQKRSEWITYNWLSLRLFLLLFLLQPAKGSRKQ